MCCENSVFVVCVRACVVACCVFVGSIAFVVGSSVVPLDATPEAPAVVRFRVPAPPPAALGAAPVFLTERSAESDDDVSDLATAAATARLCEWWAVTVDDGAFAAALSIWLWTVSALDVEVVPDFVPAVVEAEAASSGACPITTPPYDERQGYLQVTAARAAWHLPGGRGQGIRVADVEGDWNERHEDLPPLAHLIGRRQGWGWREHGTAVLGVVAARDNGKGVTGIVPDVDGVFTASLGGTGAARAIHEAAKRLAPGDVLIIELHGPGPNSRGKKGQQGFVPMEWWQAEFDAIRFATAKGVVVVEAAGNGGEDLDAPIYGGKFDRDRRDSGAILVGAGTSTVRGPDRARLGFSNFGSRVDVHAWGEDVATLDYGDLQGCSSADRKYTALFSGTSSATPIVAGAVAVVEGVHRHQRGAPLPPRAVRDLLRKTGTPQRPSPKAPRVQAIGPLPHLERALQALELLP